MVTNGPQQPAGFPKVAARSALGRFGLPHAGCEGSLVAGGIFVGYTSDKAVTCCFHGNTSKSGKGFSPVNRRTRLDGGAFPFHAYLECSSCGSRVCLQCAELVVDKIVEITDQAYTDKDIWCGLVVELGRKVDKFGPKITCLVQPEYSHCCELSLQRKDLQTNHQYRLQGESVSTIIIVFLLPPN